jgi:hypothetical protein
VLENVVVDEHTREINLDDASLTENTRASYPISQIPNAKLDGIGGHPRNIVMLTCDAFGVLPPIARLTPEQASYHFLSGYTAKVAGTERGMGKEPQATFSTCFGAPFLALPPTVYSDLLAKKMRHHDTKCWLVNTGWSGGGFGVGSRIKIGYSRAMVKRRWGVDRVIRQGSDSYRRRPRLAFRHIDAAQHADKGLRQEGARAGGVVREELRAVRTGGYGSAGCDEMRSANACVNSRNGRPRDVPFPFHISSNWSYLPGQPRRRE